jgi:hypothetical protein
LFLLLLCWRWEGWRGGGWAALPVWLALSLSLYIVRAPGRQDFAEAMGYCRSEVFCLELDFSVFCFKIRSYSPLELILRGLYLKKRHEHEQGLKAAKEAKRKKPMKQTKLKPPKAAK